MLGQRVSLLKYDKYVFLNTLILAQIFAKEQIDKARLLFAVGMEVDPRHGPLYHAYGNMEMVIYIHAWLISLFT